MPRGCPLTQEKLGRATDRHERLETEVAELAAEEKTKAEALEEFANRRVLLEKQLASGQATRGESEQIENSESEVQQVDNHRKLLAEA
jgi:hypothetical protein